MIIAGLDMDFRGVPFGPMPALMAIADDVTKVHALCALWFARLHFSPFGGWRKSSIIRRNR